jgi:Cytidylate kinase-like family
MPLDVICISSEDGADAAIAAAQVAEKLGYRIVDEEIVSKAALEAGVERELLADVERRKSLVARVLDGMSTGGMGMSYITPAPVPESYGMPRSDELRGLIRSVIEEIAGQGEVVIVAHAASVALGASDRVLRVLITASPETRVRRMAHALKVDEAEARGLLRRSDAGRRDYLKRFYRIEQELPTHYDLVLNTDRVSPEESAELIVHAAGHVAQSA